MKFAPIANQPVVFLGEKRITPANTEKKPFTLFEFADPMKYKAIEFFKSRDFIGDIPSVGEMVLPELEIEKVGTYPSISVNNIKLAK